MAWEWKWKRSTEILVVTVKFRKKGDLLTAQKNKFFINDFFSKHDQPFFY